MLLWTLILCWTFRLKAVSGDDCVDNNFQCAYWSSVHQCELNPGGMKMTCPLSCKNPCICPVVTDDVACDCIERAKKGHCENQANVMNTICRTTCTKRHSVTCPVLKKPGDQNAHLSTYNRWFLTQVDEVCNPGYQSLVPAFKGRKFCSKDGIWIDDPFYAGSISCRPVDCGEPPDLVHGKRNLSTTIYRSQVQYTCNEGYKIDSGNSLRICNESGLWSGVLPKCAVVTCPREELHALYSQFSVSSLVYNSTVVYTCIQGYNHTDGNLERTCQQNGHWSGSKPKCSIIHCLPPAEIPNSTVTYWTTEYQSIATYTCIVGYERIWGDRFRFCLETAQWSGNNIDCQIVKCGPPPLIAGAKVNSSGEEYQDVSYYECFYQEDDVNLVNWTLICDADGMWRGERRKCAAVHKTFLPDPLEADGSFGVGIVSLSIVAVVMLVIIVMDIPTIMRHSIYLKKNLRRFHLRILLNIKTVRNSLRAVRLSLFKESKTTLLETVSERMSPISRSNAILSPSAVVQRDEVFMFDTTTPTQSCDIIELLESVPNTSNIYENETNGQKETITRNAQISTLATPDTSSLVDIE